MCAGEGTTTGTAPRPCAGVGEASRPDSAKSTRLRNRLNWALSSSSPWTSARRSGKASVGKRSFADGQTPSPSTSTTRVDNLRRIDRPITNFRHVLFGYARVSTADQDPDHQIDALQRAGVARDDIYIDHASGAKASRPQLGLLALAGPWDVAAIDAGRARRPPAWPRVRRLRGRAARQASRARPRVYCVGAMLWLRRKRLSGSYFAFTSPSLRRLRPKALSTPASSGSSERPVKLR